MSQIFNRGMVLSLFLLCTFGGAVKASTEEIVEIEPQTFFVPVGFDDNDNAVAVVDGYLPDTCYRLRSAQVHMDNATGRVVIQPKAVRFAGTCLDVVVPYTTVVSLGVLPQGKYAIATRSGKTTEQLEVKLGNNSGPDDYLYVPVEGAKVSALTAGKMEAALTGRFTNNCLKIQEVKVINSGKTIEVLPIMQRLEKTENGAKCENQEVPFEYKVALPKLTAGRHLLHVRTLNGQSVNEVFTSR